MRIMTYFHIDVQYYEKSRYVYMKKRVIPKSGENLKP